MKKFVALVLMVCMMLSLTAVAEEIVAPKLIAAELCDATCTTHEAIAEGGVTVVDEAIAALDPATIGSATVFETFVVKATEEVAAKLVDGVHFDLTVEIDAKLPLPTAIMVNVNGAWALVDEYTATETPKQITFKMDGAGDVALLVASAATQEETVTDTATKTETTVVYTEDQYDSFTPSVSGKPAPVVVPSASATTVTVATIITTTKTIDVPAGNNLGVTPVSERNYAEDGAKLEKAYQSILNNEQKELLGEMVVRDLFEVTLTDEYAAYLAEDGAVIEITFDADIDPEKAFKVLCSHDSETWHEIAAENIVVNADGSVTLKLEEVGVIAFVVDAAEETVAEVTSPV